MYIRYLNKGEAWSINPAMNVLVLNASGRRTELALFPQDTDLVNRALDVEQG